MVIDPTWEIKTSSVIGRPTVQLRFNATVKIRKYKEFHEGHHFIPMAMEVHGTPGCNILHSIFQAMC
jgi:hypothetical protein